MKNFFKEPYNYLLIIISIPALLWIKETYESVSDFFRFGSSGGYAEDSIGGIAVLLLWIIMWWVNLLRHRNKAFKYMGIFLVIVVGLVLVAPFFMLGH